MAPVVHGATGRTDSDAQQFHEWAQVAARQGRQEPDRQPTETTVVHGYTLAEIHDLAGIATHTAGILAMQWHERHDLAWSAIVEHLYEVREWPSRHDLIAVGRRAIYETGKASLRHHGISFTTGATTPSFGAFWRTRPDTFEDRLLNRIALYQVLAALPERHRSVIVTRSTMDIAAMAAAMGLREKQAQKLVRAARAACLHLWFDDETPPAHAGRQPMRRRSTVTPAPCGTYPAYAMHRYRKEEPCEACREANRVHKAAARAKAGEAS